MENAPDAAAIARAACPVEVVNYFGHLKARQQLRDSNGAGCLGEVQVEHEGVVDGAHPRFGAARGANRHLGLITSDDGSE